MDNKARCKNCNSEISESYCNYCGQRTAIHKVTFSETFQDFIDTIFSVNAPLWLTIKLLVLNPGKLFRDYLSGKRKTYYKPVPFFILTTIVFVLIKALLNYDPMENMAVVDGTKLDESLINNAGIFMVKNMNNIIFSYVFSFAVIVKLFFYKKYTFAEYLAIAFYVIGFYLVITTVLMFGLQYADAQYKMVPFIVMFFYVIYAFISLFQKKNLSTFIKVALVYFISIFFYMILGLGISFLIVWIKSL